MNTLWQRSILSMNFSTTSKSHEESNIGPEINKLYNLPAKARENFNRHHSIEILFVKSKTKPKSCFILRTRSLCIPVKKQIGILLIKVVLEVFRRILLSKCQSNHRIWYIHGIHGWLVLLGLLGGEDACHKSNLKPKIIRPFKQAHDNSYPWTRTLNFNS